MIGWKMLQIERFPVVTLIGWRLCFGSGYQRVPVVGSCGVSYTNQRAPPPFL